MAYMKDSTGRRLDSIKIQSADKVASLHARRYSNTIAFLGDSFTDMAEDTTGMNSYRASRGFITWALQRLGQRPRSSQPPAPQTAESPGRRRH
jgi:hypothetical protein